LAAISGLRYPGGTTDTTGGLNIMRTQAFAPAVVRPGAKQVSIVITDGKPTVPVTVPAEVAACAAQGITTYVVGVTAQVDNATLQEISSAPHQVAYTFLVH